MVHEPLLVSPTGRETNRNPTNDLMPIQMRNINPLSHVIQYGHAAEHGKVNMTASPLPGHSYADEAVLQTTAPDGSENIIASLKVLWSSLSQIEHVVVTSALAKQHRMKLRHEWKNVALVFDRIFFVTYVLIIAISVTVLFPRPTSQN